MEQKTDVKELSDAQGMAILMAYQGKPSFEVFERDDGFVTIAFGPQMYLSEYEDWRQHEKDSMDFVKGRCLDVGCAGGRIALYLQNKSVDVVGLDFSPLALEVCKERGMKNAALDNLEHYLEKCPQGSFDSILMYGNNFGVLEDLYTAKRLLKRLCEVTSPGGLIIAESRDPYITENPVHLEYFKRNEKQGKLPGQFRMRIRFLQYATDWFDYLFVTKEQMEKVLEGTGWEVSKYLDDPMKESGEYIAIIKKSGI